MLKFNSKLAVAAIIIWTLLNAVLNKIIVVYPSLKPYDHYLTPSVVGIMFFCLFYVFKIYLWKIPGINDIFSLIFGIEKLPVISGIYDVVINSNWDDYKTEYKGRVEVVQKYDDICIKGEFNQSSFMTDFVKIRKIEDSNSASDERWSLIYSYNNKPSDTSIGIGGTGFVAHSGIVYLEINKSDLNQIIGYYGTDQNRKTRGRMLLKKVC